MLERYRVQQHKDRNRLSHVSPGIPALAPGVCRPVFTCVPPPGGGVAVPHCVSASALGGGVSKEEHFWLSSCSIYFVCCVIRALNFLLTFVVRM